MWLSYIAKTHIVHTKTEFNFIVTAYRHTQVLNVNWSAFLMIKSILLTLQSHGWYNGIHGGCQLGSGDQSLLPLTICGPLVCHWPLCGHHGCSLGVPNRGFCHLPLHPVPPHPTLPPIPPTPSISNTDGRNWQQKYHEIQPLEIEKVSYNKTNR